jgi:hypothetical protein
LPPALSTPYFYKQKRRQPNATDPAAQNISQKNKNTEKIIARNFNI